MSSSKSILAVATLAGLRLGLASASAAAAVAQSPVTSAGAGDVKWHAPSQTSINNRTSALHGSGVFGFIFNSSVTPDDEYGTYNWCNMPHVRVSEYNRPKPEYQLRFVELIHRHHKRTPYASNAFPVEPFPWDCHDARVFHYSQPADGPEPARVYRQASTSPVNPFQSSGWTGSCAFPQITAEGLLDSWQHGVDLYHVYHGLLGLLPARNADFGSAVRYRVTNNAITNQVAGMVISGMWQTADPFPLIVQPEGVDSLEPQYSCRAADSRFNAIKSGSNPEWQQHLEASAHLFRTLDDISQVRPDDAGFHASFDHYYDNLSARQCHAKPLPCRRDNSSKSSTCVTQELADTVYRMGNWEYSQVYRDQPASLEASAASFGVWVGELTTHLRDVMAGSTGVVYFHNVAHDGSLSRLLSILQIDEMVWPGMGAEVVFELYERKAGQRPWPQSTSALDASDCTRNDTLCHALHFASQTALSPLSKSKSSYYLRVLFGGQPLKSSHPALGLMDMTPIETILEYLDGLVGTGADMVKSSCEE